MSNADPGWGWAHAITCGSHTRIKGKAVHCTAVNRHSGLHVAAHPVSGNPVFWRKGLEQ